MATLGVVILEGAASASAPSVPDWTSVDVGDVGPSGSAAEANGVWTVQGAGGDIWGAADAFHFLYRPAGSDDRHLIVRVDDLQDTNPFAKAGLMVRASLDPGSATVILDAKPSGEIEFMARSTDGDAMSYISGAVLTLPAWLELTWVQPSSEAFIEAYAFVSQDGVTWSQLPSYAPMNFSQPDVIGGLAVTSHDVSQLNTAHVEGLSSLSVGWLSTDIGTTGFIGNASVIAEPNGALDGTMIVEGAGSDVWDTDDSFNFVHFQPATTFFNFTARVVSLDNTNPFAKAGLMFRDSPSPDAMEVILDAKPSGEVEFMARMCSGCVTTYLGGATVTFPGYLSLSRDSDGITFTARAGSDAAALTTVGSVQVPMGDNTNCGLAVTSHDVSQTTRAVFDQPAP